jgi:hypothetical protein
MAPTRTEAVYNLGLAATRKLERGLPPYLYGSGVRKPAQNYSRGNLVKIGLPDFNIWRQEWSFLTQVASQVLVNEWNWDVTTTIPILAGARDS